MNGTLAQLITLVSFANEFLNTNEIEADFYSKNSTFQFCNSIEFVDFKKVFLSSKVKEIVIGQNPVEWFEFLKKDGCKKLALYYQHSKNQSFAPDYKLAGAIGGGGSWFIESIFDNHSKFWASKWAVANKGAADRRIWSIKYGAISGSQPTINMHYNLADIKGDLDTTLLEIKEFAAKFNLEFWVNAFGEAHQALQSSNPKEDYYHKDLIVDRNYSLTAKQLLYAAGLSYVFGGMGSWNDLEFETKDDSDKYHHLSAKLYDDINKAIIASLNHS